MAEYMLLRGFLKMIRSGNRYRGFASFDALFSILAVLMIILVMLSYFRLKTDEINENMEKQERFDRINEIADYLVRKGAVRTEDLGNGETVVYPNWIDESRYYGIDAGKLGEKSGIENLEISISEKPERGICIYRLVVFGESREIRRFYVCGG